MPEPRFATLIRQWGEIRKFSSLREEDRSIVFYGEDAGSWSHFEPIVKHLTGELGRTVCYLTSCDSDPMLRSGLDGVRTFFVGSGSIRAALFAGLRAGVVVMTIPELGRYHIRRSVTQSVHYAYVFHSLVSTHMVYRPGAFDDYDTILCGGPHHVQELRAAEAMYDLREKNLIEHGCSRMDSIMAAMSERRGGGGRQGGGPVRVLVAPSCGTEGLIETRGESVVRALLGSGYEVTVRPHPMTLRSHGALIEGMRKRFADDPRFTVDVDVSSWESYLNADVMVSDWSGAALEFAFGCERPVLYVDVPRKVNNAGYGGLGIEPVEVGIRNEIGCLISANELEHMPTRIEEMLSGREVIARRIRRARERMVFNVGRSGAVGSRHIAAIADGRRIDEECVGGTVAGTGR